MSSETKHGIVKQPGPTCPMVDAVQEKFREIERVTRRFNRSDDIEELREMLNVVRDILFLWGSAESKLEEIRDNAALIREWGEGWKQYALGLAKSGVEA